MRNKYRILVIHQNFPGQFRPLLNAWKNRKDLEIVGIGRQGAPGMPDMAWLGYAQPGPARNGQHPYLRQMDQAVAHGQVVARLLLEIKRKGFRPDAVLAHPGWGETLYLKDAFPDAHLVHFCEWFYNGHGADIGFDPEFPAQLDDRTRIRTWNGLHLLNLENCDAAIAPTEWQRGQHPAAYLPKIRILHEGIDIERLGPDTSASFTVPGGPTLRAGDPVITYVARNLEPYRGFHVFMRTLEKIQRSHPRCHTLIVGGDGVSYGRGPKGAKTWRESMLREVKLDPQRTHFLGKLPYEYYKRVLQISAAHVYLSYPFVLSWSCLEAMASACLIVGSDTAPVREVLRNGENGLLVDFFDTDRIAETVIAVLAQPGKYRALRQRAHLDARRFDSRLAIPVYEEVLRIPVSGAGGAQAQANRVCA